MNKSISTKIGIGIILIFAIIIGGLIWLNEKKQVAAPASDIQKTTQSNKKIDQPVYKNEKYGFQVSLTDSWKNYETSVSQEQDAEFIDFCVLIPDTKMQTKIPGHVCLFKIIITDKNRWDESAGPCKKDFSSGMCDWINDEIGRSKSHVFSKGVVQDYGNEEKAAFEDIEEIIRSFQIIP